MDDRAVSRVLGYSLVLTISTVLVAGLLMSGSAFVDDQRSNVVDSELEVIGERISTDLSTADRLVRSGDGETIVRIDSNVPDRVAGEHYNVEVVTDSGDAWLKIDTSALDRSVTTPIANTTAIAPGTVSGGDVVIRYDETNDRLEVTNDS